MSENTNGNQTEIPPNFQRYDIGSHDAVTIVKIAIAIVLLFPLMHYLFYNPTPNVALDHNKNISDILDEELIKEVPASTPKPRPIQPSCPQSDLALMLEDIIAEMVRKQTQCVPDDIHNLDKHKIPKIYARNNTNETRSTIVGYFVSGLLLTSLGAAIIELYKAKSQSRKKSKTPLSRKCSLADLTVLKHHRKELLRRDSILEVPEEGGGNKSPAFRDPPPLLRRCSFPVGPSLTFRLPEDGLVGSGISRSSSRRASVFDYRRPSMVQMMMMGGGQMDSRRASMQMDRRHSGLFEDGLYHHRSRLVHRH